MAQLPAPGQRKPLSTARVESTIPTSADGAWVYPSDQMFYNAMRKKGYEPREEDMRTVVAIHNAVNERTWREILRWESLHPECLEKLRLLRFQGNPHELTPKARAHQQFGYKPPFDRHDWVVERCGREVRYLIDFYQGRASAGHAVSVHIDARPAADTLSDAWDRVRMAVRAVVS